MRRLLFILTVLLCSVAVKENVQAQSMWVSAEAKFGLTKDLSGYVGGEYRTLNSFAGTDRWSATAGLDYKVCKYVKLSAEYSYIHRHVMERITSKGNRIDSYWQPRHRAAFAVTGSYKWGQFTLSLRELYQYTHHTGGFYVGKVDAETGKVKSDEYIETKDKHLLRSRLKGEYKIRKSGFTPYLTAEIYNNFSGFAYEKSRFTIGTEYKFTKHHSVDIFYRYMLGDDNGSHVIGLGYQFKL